MHIEKLYFTLPEVLERWRISETDLIYLAENDKLRLSVRVFGAPVEFGDYEEGHDGEHFRVPWERSRYSGLLDLHVCDVFQLYRCGEIQLSEFRTPRADYATLYGEAEAIVVMLGDLLLRREERDRFETYALKGGGHVALGAIEPKFWRAFCAASGRDDWIERQQEAFPQELLRAEIAEMFAGLSVEEVQKSYADPDCCVSLVLTLTEAARHPRATGRGIVQRAPDGSLQTMFPGRIDGHTSRLREVLKEGHGWRDSCHTNGIIY